MFPRQTVWLVLDFFPDMRYNILLTTWLHYPNVRISTDGRITICLREDDFKYLEQLPRAYHDINEKNKEFLFMKEKERLFGNPNMSEKDSEST